MPKRHVAVTFETDSDANAVESPRAANGQFQPRVGGRALATMPDATERTWEPVGDSFDGPRGSLEDVLAAGETPGETPPADDAPEVPPPPSDDPDQSPPDETSPAPAPTTSPAPASREVQPTYQNAQQRAETMRRLEQSKREREKDAASQKVQADYAALQARLNSPKLADRIQALGKTPEELLEDLLLGRGDADDKSVASAAGVSPEVAELRAKVAAMEKRDNDREAATKRQANEAAQLQAVNVLAGKVGKDSGHVMIHALRQHGRLFNEIDALYDGSTEIGAVTAVVADRIETELRTAYPEVAAVLAAGGSQAAVAAAARADGAPAPAKAKAALGARGRVPASDSTPDGLPMDPGERHQAIKERYYPNWKGQTR